ncbi:MAG TPA: hypothetical protein VH299_09525 [Solirubrobacterales bacterium]|nr:hypothetical protein [Solirubrobacterales bacterium]
MKNGRFISRGLIVIALTAVVSLAAGHLVGLGDQILGSGPTSTFALVGNIAGLIACAASGWFGARQLWRSRACHRVQGC